MARKTYRPRDVVFFMLQQMKEELYPTAMCVFCRVWIGYTYRGSILLYDKRCNCPNLSYPSPDSITMREFLTYVTKHRKEIHEWLMERRPDYQKAYQKEMTSRWAKRRRSSWTSTGVAPVVPPTPTPPSSTVRAVERSAKNEPREPQVRRRVGRPPGIHTRHVDSAYREMQRVRTVYILPEDT